MIEKVDNEHYRNRSLGKAIKFFNNFIP